MERLTGVLLPEPDLHCDGVKFYIILLYRDCDASNQRKNYVRW